MVKFRKSNNQQVNYKRRYDEVFAYRTVIISAALGGICLFFSFLFNSEIITFFMNQNFLFDVFDIIIKVTLILLSFLFFLISLANYKELTGKPMSLKELLLLIIFTFLQTILNLVVFGYTVIGLLLIVIYLFLTQNS
ncbi:MAG: hypothetical protein EU550_00470 [Promethearchaeota archaeon]|nr:MAG: hypothetical protein EU550_00470 [Candidatus Lokiarchaeota archaeon]